MKDTFLNSISDIKRRTDGSFVAYYDGYPYHIPSDTVEYIWVTEYVKENHITVTAYDEEVYKYTSEEKAEQVRTVRNSLIIEADNLLLKYQEQVELGLIAEKESYRIALLQYKQDLRELPSQAGFPDVVEYPALPKYDDYIK